MSRLALLALATGALLALPAAASADPLPTGGTLLVGAAAPGVFAPLPTPVEGSDLDQHAVSHDGRYVAFTSEDGGLVAGDDDRAKGIYRKDRQTGDVVLVSRSTTGAPNHGPCADASVSADGNRVAFTCTEALDPADSNGVADVYVRDVAAGTTTLVSRTTSAIADEPSQKPEISGDGQWVAFTSTATNLVSPAPPAVEHVYRRAVAGGAVALVDRPNGASQPNGPGTDPTISDDGDRVAFSSEATNLSSTLDANGVSDIYVRLMSASITAAVSTVNGDGATIADGAAYQPAISGNGTAVAYTSRATNDAPGDSDTQYDVHLRVLDGTAAVVLVSRATGTGGAKANDWSGGPELDTSGQWVAFLSDATNLDASSHDYTQAYVRHLGAAPTTELASRGADPAPVAASSSGISGDASTVVFVSEHVTPDSDPFNYAVFARSLNAHATDLVSRSPGADPFVTVGETVTLAGPGALSADGRYAVFQSRALGLPGSVPGVEEIWRRDNLTGDVVLVSRADGAAGAPAQQPATDATISADGNRVAFLTDTSLTPEVGVLVDAVYVRDIAAGTTVLASRASGASGAVLGPVSAPFLAAGGTRVAFVSDDSALGTNGYFKHPTVRDLATGTTTVVGADQEADARAPRLDAAGDRVVWDTGGGLTSGLRPAKGHLTGPATGPHAYWAVVATGTPHPLDDQVADGVGSSDATLSEDGARAAFTSADALLAEDAHAGKDVYVRDLPAGGLHLVSAGAGGAAPDGASTTAAVSGDGRSVAFASSATNLVADDADGALSDIFVRDLAAGVTTLASRGDGATGPALDTGADSPALSRDGGCVLFRTDATTLAPGLSPYVFRAWLRAVRGTCPVAPPGDGGGPAGGPGGGSGGGTPPTGQPGTKARRPVLTGFRAHPQRFSRRGRRAGTRFTLHVDRAATIRIAVARLTRGHRAGGRCRAGRGTRRCTVARRIVTLRATARRVGTVSVRFTARVHGRRIARGAYRATATAKGPGGTSKAVRVMLRAR